MRRFTFQSGIDEANIKKSIKELSEISAYFALKILDQLGIEKYLTRLRTPEEIYHLLNFSNLEKEFGLLFGILHKNNLLSKEGDFYEKSYEFVHIKQQLQEKIEDYNTPKLMPFIAIFQSLSNRYMSIINGEYGKMGDQELTAVLDEIYGSELMLVIKEFQYIQLERRIQSFREKEHLNIVNIGIGSGYDALHLADFFGEKATVLSIEPPGTLERCRILQDLYEIYNVDFIEKDNVPLASLKNSVDLFVGKANNELLLFKEEIELVRQTLTEEGHLLLFLNDDFMQSMNWIMSIFENFEPISNKNEFIARLKHYGLSRVKYLGLDNSIITIQKALH